MTHNPAEALRDFIAELPRASMTPTALASRILEFQSTLTSPAPAGGEGEPVQELHVLPPPASGDVAGVVEYLRQRADDFEKQPERLDQFYDGDDARRDSQAATLLESLSAEKGRLVEALTEIARQKLADSMPSQDWADTDFEEAYDCCIRRARTALTPKEKA